MQVLAAGAAIFALVCVVLLIVARDNVQSTYITLLFFAVFIYLLGNYIEIAYQSLEATKVGMFIRFIIVPYIPTIWYFCVRKYCGLSFKYKWQAPLFFIIPTLFAYICLTWESNHLLIQDVYYMYNNGYGNPTIQMGPLEGFRNVYQFGINLLGVFTIFWYRIRGAGRLRHQAILFLMSVFIPISNTLTYFTKVGDYYVDITPYSLLFVTTLTLLLYFFSFTNLTDIIRYSTIDSINEGILYFDKGGLYLGSNTAAVSVFPLLKTAEIGTDIKSMAYLPIDSLVESNPAKLSKAIEFTIELRGVCNTYSVSVAQIHRRAKIIGYSLIVNNITQFKQLLQDMEEKSQKDALTGLYNKGFLSDYGETLLADATLGNKNICIIMMDIDFFKRVNDTHGHPYGDFILKEVSRLCDETFRNSDYIVRYGGEEFCILMPNTSYEAAKKKAELFRTAIQNHLFENGGIVTQITVSMGIAFNSLTTNSMEDMIKIADERLYYSKQHGRNLVS